MKKKKVLHIDISGGTSGKKTYLGKGEDRLPKDSVICILTGKNFIYASSYSIVVRP